MNNYCIIFLLMFISLFGFSQSDTIYKVNNKIIVADVTEISTDQIKFKYPLESLINIMNINSISKIIFSSGRIQEFNSVSLSEVKDISDWDNIIITDLQSDVKGLFRMGEVSSKAKGTTILANMSRVRQRAIHKLKVGAFLLGGNIIKSFGISANSNRKGVTLFGGGGEKTSTVMSGLCYSSNVPDLDRVISILENNNFYYVNYYKLENGAPTYSQKEKCLELKIFDVYTNNGFVYLDCSIGEGLKVVRHNHDNDLFLMWKEKRAIYNARISLTPNILFLKEMLKEFKSTTTSKSGEVKKTFLQYKSIWDSLPDSLKN